MSDPVGYALSAQQRAAIVDGRPATVALWSSLPGVTAEAAPALLTAATRRHEVFRSVLTSAAALREPLQSVRESADVSCTILEGARDRLDVLSQLASALDPVEGPVLCAAVLPVDRGCAMAMVACAAFADVPTLTDVVATMTGSAANVEDPIQYVEYAAYQVELLAAEDPTDARDAEAVWSRMAAATASGGTRLPEPPGTDVGSAGDDSVVVAPEEPAGDRLGWWLARWLVVVARLTGEREISLAVDLDPRGNPELAGAAGPYRRLVPISFEVPVTGPLAAFEAEIADALTAARAWIEWAPAPGPMALVVGSAPEDSWVREDPARAGVQVEVRVDEDAGRAVVRPGPGGTAEQAERAAEALSTLVASRADRVEDLDVLGADQVERLLGSESATAETSLPVLARVLAHAEEHPDSLALTDGRRRLGYADLVHRVDGLARAILGAGAEGPVVVRLPRSVEALVAMLAAQRAGLGYVALDDSGPFDRVAEQAVAAGSRVWVTDGPVPGGAVLVRPDASEPAGDLPEPDPGHLAYVIFTSGSTGRPKGVAVGQDSLAAYVDAVLPVVRDAARTDLTGLVWGQVTGLTTDLGNTAIYGALGSGGTLHLLPTDLLGDPDAMSAHLATSPVDVLKITPTHLGALLDERRADVLPRRVLVTGGEALSWELVETARSRGHCRVVNHYGPTETTVGALTHAVDLGPRTGSVPIGRPLAGYEALVVDERMRLVPNGARGELLIGGAGLARGYVADEASTTARFVEHPYRPGRRVYRTGDVVRRDPDGAITFLGRADGQVKVRGFRVETAEVEQALTRHPSVRRAAVVLRTDPGTAPLLVAYVVTQVNPAPSEADLRAHVGALLPDHMVPSRFVDLDTLPMRANGKLDVTALPVPPQARSTGFVTPEGPTETAVAAIFAEALGLAEVGAEDDFFALGGHSLLATRVVVDLRERLGVQLPVYSLFEAPTVRALAGLVDDAAPAAVDPDELAAMIAEIASLSDEEAARLLAEEAGTAESGGVDETRP